MTVLLVLAGCAANRAQRETAGPYEDPRALKKGEILHLETGRLFSEPELIEYLSHYRVIFVGETHDSIDDHAVELAILRGLHDRWAGQMALGLEMLPRKTQGELDAYVQGEMEEDAFARVWVKHWGHTFRYYEAILRFAREHRIKVLALNADDDLRKAVREKPVEELDPGLAERLPEMDLEDPHHRAMTEAIFAAHKMGPRDTEAFYRVQVLWDETMAQTAADFLQSPEGQGKRLVIFAGGHHIRYGYGIPRRLFQRVPLPYAIVLPFAVEIPENKRDRMMDVKAPDLPMPPGDFVWAVGYTDLEDVKEEGQ